MQYSVSLPPPRIENWDWQAYAACRGMEPNLFFESSDSTSEEEMARRICRRCPVLSPCRSYAIEAGEPYGIWGGLSPRERRLLRLRCKWIPARPRNAKVSQVRDSAPVEWGLRIGSRYAR